MIKIKGAVTLQLNFKEIVHVLYRDTSKQRQNEHSPQLKAYRVIHMVCHLKEHVTRPSISSYRPTLSG
jgi:hypothetical protein